ncbi:hypothetical protein VCSRO146_0288 [Vibrio cholerae]|nr:hypothetical protein VCSRO146_0288 [Vibrio cholerae]
MMVLTLLTKQIDGEFTVYWKTGLRRGGELKVDLGEQYDKLPEQQKPIAAELYHTRLDISETLFAHELRLPAAVEPNRRASFHQCPLTVAWRSVSRAQSTYHSQTPSSYAPRMAQDRLSTLWPSGSTL